MTTHRGPISLSARRTTACPGLLRQLLVLAESFALGLVPGCAHVPPDTHHPMPMSLHATERQVTHGPVGRIVTNIGAWSPDSEWVVYDTRSDAAGTVFDGETIEMVNVRTRKVRQLYRAANGARCGAATFHPHEWKVVFMHGPENPTPDWSYNFWHRRGVMVDATKPGVGRNLDALDVSPPFTPGALRGGSHVHVWDAAGDWVSFTYEDHVLAQFNVASATNDINQRNVGVSVPVHPVEVKKDHPRNHNGDYFSVLVTRTTADPRPGSDEIKRAGEEGWVGTNGFVRSEGTRQQRALAFQGSVVTTQGETISEVFIADLPEDLTQAGAGPLCGTETRAPYPPKGVTQRRLTFTADRKFPGLQGPRHWLRCSPDGSRIAFLMKDAAGVVQLWTVSPNGGEPRQLTRNAFSIASTFTWSPHGRRIAYVMDNSVCVADASSGVTTRLTPRSDDATAPRPEACVFSPDGKKITFVRRVPSGDRMCNQIHVLFLEP
jgi:hypothetical protein